jgi:hypothetical protein
MILIFQDSSPQGFVSSNTFPSPREQYVYISPANRPVAVDRTRQQRCSFPGYWNTTITIFMKTLEERRFRVCLLTRMRPPAARYWKLLDTYHLIRNGLLSVKTSTGSSVFREPFAGVRATHGDAVFLQAKRENPVLSRSVIHATKL